MVGLFSHTGPCCMDAHMETGYKGHSKRLQLRQCLLVGLSRARGLAGWHSSDHHTVLPAPHAQGNLVAGHRCNSTLVAHSSEQLWGANRTLCPSQPLHEASVTCRVPFPLPRLNLGEHSQERFGAVQTGEAGFVRKLQYFCSSVGWSLLQSMMRQIMF